jgi:hypothetical protein
VKAGPWRRQGDVDPQLLTEKQIVSDIMRGSGRAPEPKPIRFARSARKHRIGRGHVLAALSKAGDPVVIPPDEDFAERLVWVGVDDRGMELEIVAVVQPDTWLIIHVMPTWYRRRGRQR